MTAIETPAMQLRWAARRVRDLGQAALDGPWVARHTTNDGWPIDAEPREGPGMGEAPAGDDELGSLTLVARTALPRTDGGMAGRDPAHYQSHHILAEHVEDDLAPEQAQELFDSYRWAAMLAPHVAEPLANLLDQLSRAVDHGWIDPTNALAFAHLILERKAATT